MRFKISDHKTLEGKPIEPALERRYHDPTERKYIPALDVAELVRVAKELEKIRAVIARLPKPKATKKKR